MCSNHFFQALLCYLYNEHLETLISFTTVSEDCYLFLLLVINLEFTPSIVKFLTPKLCQSSMTNKWNGHLLLPGCWERPLRYKEMNLGMNKFNWYALVSVHRLDQVVVFQFAISWKSLNETCIHLIVVLNYAGAAWLKYWH